MKIKIYMILLVFVILSCQKKDISSPNANIEIKEDTVIEQAPITIKSLEGYHMDALTIVQLIVEDEIVKVRTLFWEDNKVMYSDAIFLDESFDGNDWMFDESGLLVSIDNFYYLQEFDNDNYRDYSFIIKTDKVLIANYHNCYGYLGKDINNEIIAALSGQQNEYTGKYIYSKMESTETMKTFLDDNNLEKTPRKTISDFENSYITIAFAGNGALIIGASEGLRNSLLFWGDRYPYPNEIDSGAVFYMNAGDSWRQSFHLTYIFNEEREIEVFLSTGNEYKFFYRRIGQ